MSSDLDLRRRLQDLGLNVGPITNTTRGLYEARLHVMESERSEESGTGSEESGTGSEESGTRNESGWSENGTSGVSLSVVFPRPHSRVLPTGSTPMKYDWELLPGEVTICTKHGFPWTLGAGGYGEVFKALRDQVDEVAVKRIRKIGRNPAALTKFKTEIDLISKLRHRHIVQFYGACVQPPNLSIVMELMSSDLYSVLHDPEERDHRYTWTGVYGKKVLIGVALGLNYLHSRTPPVVHRDIKSPNILVMDGLAKIADVGLARSMISMDMTPQSGFTYNWAAPEVTSRERATEKVDIWSFGIILWEVVSGNEPIPESIQGGLPARSQSLIKKLYKKCTDKIPAGRPKASDVIRELRM